MCVEHYVDCFEMYLNPNSPTGQGKVNPMVWKLCCEKDDGMNGGKNFRKSGLLQVRKSILFN